MKKSMLRSVAILATLAVSAITAATAEARWVSVGVNGLAVNDTSRACTDGIHIEGATQGGGIGFTGRWVPSGGTIDDLASPIAIERGFTPPLVPFDFPAVDPPVAIDANNDGSIDPGSELFPFYGIIDTRWDGGLQLPVGAHVRLTAPFSDVFRALVFDGPVQSCTLFSTTTPVKIDIDPLTATNVVRPLQPSRPILVSLLSSATFAADSAVFSAIRFGKTGTEAAPLLGLRIDVNRDGRRDLVLVFRTGSTGIACGDTTALLRGVTAAGAAYSGTDSITTRC